MKFFPCMIAIVALTGCKPWDVDGEYCEGGESSSPYSEAGFDYNTSVTPTYPLDVSHPIRFAKAVRTISDTSQQRITIEITTKSGDIYRLNYKVGKPVY